MNIKLTSKNGTTLKTANKYCTEDINITIDPTILNSGGDSGGSSTVPGEDDLIYFKIRINNTNNRFPADAIFFCLLSPCVVNTNGEVWVDTEGEEQNGVMYPELTGMDSIPFPRGGWFDFAASSNSTYEFTIMVPRNSQVIFEVTGDMWGLPPNHQIRDLNDIILSDIVAVFAGDPIMNYGSRYTVCWDKYAIDDGLVLEFYN